MTEQLPPITQEFRGDASNLLREEKKIEGAYDDLGKKSKETSDGIGKDTKDSEKAFSDFDRLLRSKLKDEETALDGFQRELTESRTKVANLRAELQKSSGADSLGIFQDLKAAESDLKSLERIGDEILPGFKKSMGNAGQQGGKELAKETESGWSSVMGDTSLMGPIIGGLVASSPLLIAMLGSAVATAVGTVGVVGGIVGAARDPKVQAAFAGLGHEALHIFSEISDVFVGPVMAGIGDIESMLARAEPGLEDAFRVLSEAARPLLDGFGGFITQMLPGLEKAFRDSEPLLEEFAKLLPFLGAALGQMFADIAKDGTGGKLALESLVGIIGGAVVAVGKLINWSEHLFTLFMEGMRDVTGAGADFLSVVSDVASALNLPGAGKINDLAAGLQRAHDQFAKNIDDAQRGSSVNGLLNVVYAAQIALSHELGGQLHYTAQQMDDLVQAQDKMISAAQGADDAFLGMHQALSAFNKQLRDGKHDWDINHTAGQANVAALNSANQAITRYYDSLAQLHPLNTRQVSDELAAEQALYRQARAAGASNDELSTISDTIKLLQQRLHELNGTTSSFNVIGHIIGVSPSRAGIRAFAEGGVVHADQGLVAGVLPPRDPGTLMVLAGERRTKGEIFAPLAGISQDRAMGLGQTLGDAYDFDVVPKVPRGYAYAGGGGVQAVVIPISIGGKHMATVHQALIGPSQRYKARTGTTGLS